MFPLTTHASRRICGVLSKTVCVFLVSVLVSSQAISAYKSKILLKDIETLTFHDGSYTEHRRVTPVEQLKCVGGTAAKYTQYRPRTVQCYNKGYDGRSVQWKCNAELSNVVRFGRLDVNCEGYDYPEDRYVLAGSCALGYELDFKKESSSPNLKMFSNAFGFLPYLSTFVSVAVFLTVALAIWCLYIRDASEPGFASTPRVEPTAPLYPDGPPSYDDTMRGDYSSESAYPGTRFRGHAPHTGYGWNLGDDNGTSSASSFWPPRRKIYQPAPAPASNGPSYWATGASAFAGSFLGSSLFGSRGGCSPGYNVDPPPRDFGESRTERERGRSSSSDGETYQATGFATTSGR